MKAYIINLSRIESSYNSALRLQEELRNYGIRAELFEGSYGNEIIKEYKNKKRNHHPYTFKGPNNPVSEDFKEKQSTPGVIGCFDSHYRLWQKCAELDEPIMIFEDDAHIIRPYYPVEFEDVLSVVSSHGKKMNKYEHHMDNPQGEPSACYYHRSSMPGAAGYVIKPHAAKILVDEFKNSFLPADNAIMQHLVTIEIHSHMMGKAIPRSKFGGKSSLIRTNYWSKI
jgi:GR25 family glycosyltransferase involved in LPS biosynthesis